MYEILFSYGHITFKTFNLFLAAAFLAGIIFLLRFIELKKIKLRFFTENFAWFLIFPLLGGRLFYVFQNLSFFKSHILKSLFVWDFGFSSFGIFYSAVLTLYILSRRRNEDIWMWADGFALSGLAGMFFIHIGHFFNGTDYGKPTDIFFGIPFDTVNIPFTTPIHPTQLYSAALSFIIVGISMRVVKRIHLTGMAGTLAVMLYSIGAFAIDFLHGSPSAYARINYLFLAALAFVFYIRCSHKKLFS